MYFFDMVGQRVLIDIFAPLIEMVADVVQARDKHLDIQPCAAHRLAGHSQGIGVERLRAYLIAQGDQLSPDLLAFALLVAVEGTMA